MARISIDKFVEGIKGSSLIKDNCSELLSGKAVKGLALALAVSMGAGCQSTAMQNVQEAAATNYEQVELKRVDFDNISNNVSGVYQHPLYDDR
ncbi:MAG: hypothetical protein AB3N14_04595, partial [Flavobacteriaceae bacterium]